MPFKVYNSTIVIKELTGVFSQPFRF